MNKLDTSSMIFVFGSNLSGIHGAGAARYALQERGAKMGYPIGPQGMSYAIPTKDRTIRKTLEFMHIRRHVQSFLAYAEDMEHMQFQITRIGCGLAGLQDQEMAMLFFGATQNCYFDVVWARYFEVRIQNQKSEWTPQYWGTF